MNIYKLVLLIISFILLGACNYNSKKYLLNGNVKNIPDSTQVVLVIEKENDIVYDTTQIIGGKIHFEGSLEEGAIYVASIRVNHKRIEWKFFIENSIFALNYDGSPKYWESQVRGGSLQGFNASFNDNVYKVNYLLYKKRSNLSKQAFPFPEGIYEAEELPEIQKILYNEYVQCLDSINKNSIMIAKDWISKTCNPLFQSVIMNNSKCTPKEKVNFYENLPISIQESHHVKGYLKKARKETQRAETREALQVGKKYRQFEALTKTGKLIQVSEIVSENKFTLIDFWASWCGYCRTEFPKMKEDYKKYHKQGLEIVAISLDKKRESWLIALEEDKTPWMQFTTDNVANLDSLYDLGGIPRSVLVDSEGTIIATNLRGNELEYQMKKMLIFK